MLSKRCQRYKTLAQDLDIDIERPIIADFTIVISFVISTLPQRRFNVTLTICIFNRFSTLIKRFWLVSMLFSKLTAAPVILQFQEVRLS